MNARVFMVLVFSAVFMGIWNSDQKAMDSAIARHKRSGKPIAVFSRQPVETVRRENLSPAGFAGPEQRLVRIAMRASSNVGQSEPVIQRHEELIHHKADAKSPVVMLTPISEEVPETQTTNIEDQSISAEASDVTVTVEPATSEADIPELAVPATEPVLNSEVESAETPVLETLAIESPAPELPVSQSQVTEIVAEIGQDDVPAPEDFSVEVKSDAGVAQTVESEEPVCPVLPVLVAENSTEETVADASADVSVENSQPVAESAETELPEPADPIVQESAVPSDVVAMNATANTTEPIVGESEDEKSLEEKLLKSGEYDMLDVHSENVAPGTVEPALDGGATCIPMPRNLASGTWQVIHPSGEFFRITVDRGANSSADRSHGDEETLETSFCITTSPDGIRWCFIRSFVDSPAPVRRVTTEFFAPGQQ